MKRLTHLFVFSDVPNINSFIYVLRIGICYDRPDDYPDADGPSDQFAEFEPESTIVAMEQAIIATGHTPVRLGAPRELLRGRPQVDLIWNIAEGYGTRNREAWVPILCEMYRIPFLGSDALTLSVSLDKAATKQIARNLGIPTSDWIIAPYRTIPSNASSSTPRASAPGTESYSAPGTESSPAAATTTHVPLTTDTLCTLDGPLPPFPLFLKPRYEGTAKGITERNIVSSPSELIAQINHLHLLYRQDVLIEAFLPGSEFTVALSGCPLQTHPVLERGLDAQTGIGFHVMEALQPGERDYTLQQALTSPMEAMLQWWSRQLCDEMSILDFARFDFKCDSAGNPYFLEVNPLPTFAIDNTFAILAELKGESYPEFLAEVLQAAIERVAGPQPEFR
jgi:D-alanine-D-alanine ligase